jgi:hypothetical protein
VPAGFESVTGFFTFQYILHIKSLAGRESLASTEEKQESVTMPDEDGSEPLRGVSDWHSGSLVGGGAARSVVEQHDGEWSWAVRHPEKCFEPEFAAEDLYCARQ